MSAWSWVNSDSSKTHVICLLGIHAGQLTLLCFLLSDHIQLYLTLLTLFVFLVDWAHALICSICALINWAYAFNWVWWQSWSWFCNCCFRLTLWGDLPYGRYAVMTVKMKVWARRTEKSISETEKWVHIDLFLQERDYWHESVCTKNTSWTNCFAPWGIWVLRGDNIKSGQCIW